jgi:hypothetical protein
MVQGIGVELDAVIIIVCPKERASKLGAIVNDDMFWGSKSIGDLLQKLDCKVIVNLDDRHGLGPLDKLVDGDVEVLVATNSLREKPQDVKPLDHEAQ